MDFVKSGCEKSWAEVQAVSFSFECRGCAKMKELEVELEQLRQLIVARIGREEVGCANCSGGETVDDKAGEDDERDSRESSPQSGRRLRGSKMTDHKETACKETERKEKGRKETGVTETGGKITGVKEKGGKETGAREMGGKEMGTKVMGMKKTGVREMGARESRGEGRPWE